LASSLGLTHTDFEQSTPSELFEIHRLMHERDAFLLGRCVSYLANIIGQSVAGKKWKTVGIWDIFPEFKPNPSAAVNNEGLTKGEQRLVAHFAMLERSGRIERGE